MKDLHLERIRKAMAFAPKPGPPRGGPEAELARLRRTRKLPPFLIKTF